MSRRINAAALILAIIAGSSGSAQADNFVILGFGDSLMAGYGLSEQASFPVQLEKALQENGHDATVVNAGVSGDTSAGGRSRIDWALADSPDIVLLELGANDGLRGLDPAQTKANLADMIEKSQNAGAVVVLAGMMAPRNLGRDYAEEFDAMYPDLADSFPDILFYSFFLQGVAADPALNQADGIHPNPAGVSVIVQNILPTIELALKRAQEKSE
ncbi:MAG: arylesterase [Alphaproteobacteria bacterium]